MSPSGSCCLLEALNVLRRASGESLRPHRTELLAVVQKIDQSATSSVASCHDLPFTRPGNSGRPLSSASCPFLPGHQETLKSIPAKEKALLNRSRDHHAYPQPPSPVSPSFIEVFVKELERDLQKIERLLSEVGCDTGQEEPSWTTDDPRIVDIQLAGERTSAQAALRRGLSQRSLAIEFSDWEERVYGTSKVKQRSNQSSTEPGDKSGHLKEYLDINKHRFNNMEIARGGIQHGIKLLVCEQLLGGVGYSAIFIFRYSRLLKVKNTELRTLKEVITSSECLTKLAGQKADWFDRCQSDYNAWSNGFTPRRATGTKRRRLLRYQPLQAREPNSEVNTSGTQGGEPSLAPVQQEQLGLEPSGYARVEGPSLAPAHQEQLGQMLFEPSGYARVEGPSLASAHQELGQMLFEPSGYARVEGPSLASAHQELGQMLFEPSGYARVEGPSLASAHQELGQMLFEPSGYARVEGPSLASAHQEQLGQMLFEPSGYAQVEGPTMAPAHSEQLGQMLFERRYLPFAPVQ